MRHAGILISRIYESKRTEIFVRFIQIAAFVAISTVSVFASENFALNGIATASSFNPPGIPEHAIDGSHDASTSNTYWSSGASIPLWWALDLTTVAKVENVTMRIRGDSNPLCNGSPCYDFRIEASLNGAVWDTIITETSTLQALYSYPIDSLIYRYFKVFFTMSNDWAQWANIVEFEVWGDSITSSAPSASTLISPPDSSGKPIFNMLPTFDWNAAVDPDPFDTIRYKLEISINPLFTFVNTIDSITTAQHTLTDSLEFGKHYWWRVTAYDTDNLSAQSEVKDFWTWTLGDVNHSHTVNIQDLNYMVSYFFSGGPPISPFFVGDINGNCGVNVQDLIYPVAYFFSGGPAPKVGCSP